MKKLSEWKTIKLLYNHIVKGEGDLCIKNTDGVNFMCSSGCFYASDKIQGRCNFYYMMTDIGLEPRNLDDKKKMIKKLHREKMEELFSEIEKL